MKFLKLLTLTLTLFTFTQCSGGSPVSAPSRLFVFDMGEQLVPAANLNVSLETEILTNSEYEYQVFISTTDEPAVDYGFFKVEVYNESRNLFGAHADLPNGEYLLTFQLTKTISNTTESTLNATEPSSTTLNLALVTSTITVKDSIIDIDLSESIWDFNHDEDKDGASNLDELNQGSDPFNADSDNDGALDGADAFPTDASDWLDTDADKVGDKTDNCINTINFSQDDTDQDDIGDACDIDADNDTINDDTDNCPQTANTDQINTDQDEFGDACDDDKDNDGLTNEQEVIAGTNSIVADSDGDGSLDGADTFPTDATESQDQDSDGFGDNSDNCVAVTNVNQVDTDADNKGNACDDDDDDDGLSDTNDNCPITMALNSLTVDPTNQTDDDNDGYGSACDCNDANANYNPGATDKPDTQLSDTNCDSVDGDLAKAVFVTTTDDLNQSITTAFDKGFDVYLTTGDHNVTDLNLKDGVSIYGGFDINFESRSTTITTGSPTTIHLDVSEIPSDDQWVTALSVSDFNSKLTLGSLSLTTTSDHNQIVLLEAQNMNLALENTLLQGSDAATSEVLLITKQTDLEIKASYFKGYASGSSTGHQSSEDTGSIVNSIFSMNDAINTVGLDLEDSSLDIINNTIDAGAHAAGTAFGIQYSSGAPVFINNIFITQNNNLHASIRCQGELPVNPIIIQNNAFFRYSIDVGQHSTLTFPAYISCNATEDYLSSLSELQHSDYNSEITASGNQVDNRVAFANDNSNGLVTILDGNYNVIEAATDYVRNKGQDTSGYDVTHDFNANERDLPYNIGAID